MSIQEVEVTLEELQALDQEQIVSSCKSPVYYELESAFGSIKDSNAARLLSATCSMHLKLLEKLLMTLMLVFIVLIGHEPMATCFRLFEWKKP